MGPTARQQRGNLTVYTDGRTRPGTPNLYFTAWHTTTNLVVVLVGSHGKVDFYTLSLMSIGVAMFYRRAGGCRLRGTTRGWPGVATVDGIVPPSIRNGGHTAGHPRRG